MTRRVKLTTLSALTALLAPLMFTSGAAHAEGLDYFKGKMTPFTKKPDFSAPGPSFDAVGLRQGQDDLQHPAIERQSVHREYREGDGRRGQEGRPRLHGMGKPGQPHRICSGHEHGSQSEGQSDRSSGGAGSSRAGAAGQGGRGCGNPSVASHFNGYEQSAEVAKFAAGDVPIDYFTAGGLLVDWAVAKTEGKLNALIVTAPGPLSSDSTLAGMKAELAKCEGCKSKVVEFPDPGPARSRPAFRPRCSPIPRSTTSS